MNTALMTIVSLQVYRYYTRYNKTDAIWLRAFVGIVWSTDWVCVIGWWILVHRVLILFFTTRR